MIQEDILTRKLYAQDASMYEELPEAVAFPKTREDIQALVRGAYIKGMSITARGAGTSLAGQATGGSIVMDVSRFMNKITEVNVEARTARVEPGVIRDELNRNTEAHGLFFGPDTSTTNRCVIGGMIGNNSSGSFSVKYGTTRDHVLSIDTVLSDGSLVTFKPLSAVELDAKMRLQTLEGFIYRGMIRIIQKNRKKILDSYPHPEIIRRNTGYALDRLCMMQPFVKDGPKFNLAELLCGSEGTLGMTAAATLNLVKKEKHRLLIIPQFNDLHHAMKATVEIVKEDPAAVELVDDIILDATKGNAEHRKNRFFLKGDPACILIVQLEDDNLEKLVQRAEDLISILKKKDLGYAHPVYSDENEMERVWDLRKAGLGLLMGLGKDSRSPTFCEDTAVRVEDLPDYVNDFKELLKRHDTSCVFYAHASVGELHLRPVIDITKESGLKKMKVMAGEIADLVKKYRGSLSGEHGDGRARAPYIEKVLGSEMMPLLREVKELWDPHYLFNPGKIIDPEPVDQDLRYSPAYKPAEAETVFKWRKEGGFSSALELCNGAGVCRKKAESGGTMCPSYMATLDEKDNTRGRANIFRQVFTGSDPEEFGSDDLAEALDLCLSCKACKTECPANVDMSRMKAEFQYGRSKLKGKGLRTRFFTGSRFLFQLGSKFPGLVNAVNRSTWFRAVLEKTVGISKKRVLPAFADQTFEKWWEDRKVAHKEGMPKVILWIDTYTNYNEPEPGMAAVKVLENMGFEVIISEGRESGRAQISKGVLDKAVVLCEQNIREMTDGENAKLPVIGVEPSEILTFRDEYPDLVTDDMLENARVLAGRTYTFEEFVLQEKDSLKIQNRPEDPAIMLHGHCHMKALVGNEPTRELLSFAGYDVEELDSGCCGMAGSFGYEKEHYDLSMKIGGQRLFPAIEKAPDSQVCAPGFSCRHQIKDGTGRTALHVAELLNLRLRN